MLLTASEIRGVFIHEATYAYSPNWNVIAETLAGYDIPAVFVHDQGGFGRRPDSLIRPAIDAFHAQGIEYHTCMAVLGETKPATSLGTEALRHDGTVISAYWHDPILARPYIMQNLEDYFDTFPDVDGFMFDYIRYNIADSSWTDACKAEFEEWLGEGPITDWTPFYPGGARETEWLIWRNNPVSDLVENMCNFIKSRNPQYLISAAVWSYFSDNPIY